MFPYLVGQILKRRGEAAPSSDTLDGSATNYSHIGTVVLYVMIQHVSTQAEELEDFP